MRFYFLFNSILNPSQPGGPILASAGTLPPPITTLSQLREEHHQEEPLARFQLEKLRLRDVVQFCQGAAIGKTEPG